MTLFVTFSRRRYEISDLYLIALTFYIFFMIGKIVREVIEKQKQKRENSKYINMPNPKGGSLGIELSDNNELALTILSCIADNENYLVKNKELIKIVFGLVHEKIKNEYLVFTPNIMRFLALKLINNNQSVIVKIGNIVVSSNNRVRISARVLGTAVIALVGGLFAAFLYAIFMALIYFDATENCGYKCSDYFEHLPKEGPVRIHVEKPTGNLVIVGNDDARQVEIYTPLKVSDEIILSDNVKTTITKSYSKSQKKAKEVKFSDFKKTDPVLATFDNLEEPAVHQKPCLTYDPHDVIGIRID